MNDEENWLHGAQIECSHCQQQLYRVDHSPFYDCYFLYCNRCPIHVEVCYYDPVFKQISQQVRQAPLSERGEMHQLLMQAMEAHLKPCFCGGIFLHDAPRRCFVCHTPLISTNPDGVDLFPVWLVSSPDDDAAFLEWQAQGDRWTAQFERTENIW
jgi:hypothetical protein